MKIVRFTASNIKRLVAVEITPDGKPLVRITGKNGAGKQQPLSEPVLTPGGWVSMGSLRIGSMVIGSDGAPTEVTGFFPQTERRTFLVTMSDGASTRCGPDHLWTVESWQSRGGESVRIKETITTDELQRRGMRYCTARKWSVPLVAAVSFSDTGRELPIEPYALGVILGDGHIEPTGYVTVTSYDPEVFEVLGVDGWRGRDNTVLGTAFWSRPLQHLGLGGKRSYEKFIPEIYQMASIEDRRKLLAGLMDTDGTADKSWASYCTTSEQLANDVVRLGASLGYLCKKRDGATKKFRYNGELREGRMAWNVAIKSSESPFSLERKTANWSVSVLRPEPRRFIDRIEQVNDEDSACIQIAAADGLYVTKDFILTHNTSVLDAILMALGGERAIPSEPIRRGASKAVVEIDLGEIIVRRKFTSKGTTLEVTAKDGSSLRTPQAVLDKLVGDLSFDPLDFARLKPREQLIGLAALTELDLDREGLMKAAWDGTGCRLVSDGTDLELLEEFENILEHKRHDAGVAAKALAAWITEGEKTTAVIQPVDMAALAAKRKARQEEHRAWSDRRFGYQTVARAIDGVRMAEETAQREVDRCRESLRLAEEALGAKKIAMRVASLAMQDVPELGPEPTFDDLDAEAANADEINRRAGQAAHVRAKESEARAAAAAHQRTEAALAAFRDFKRQTMEAADFPVPGLSFGDNEVLFNGLPLDQASDAERLRVAVAIAMAANPKLRVIRIRDGSLLDSAGMAALEAMATDREMQVWIECVSEDRNIGVHIEDGEVVAIDGVEQ